ncbi:MULTISPECIES: SDR family NAD(P)-dependent oxidoreductase [unclassified Sphingobium]|uniref:SDR family NAD(P)-dependent oxidoreductase n=1 Tax=unclassified Sphingobium TaxID=2611147 RepID=UPI001E645270|nr:MULTISPECIES: SDR family NAD(P)-dependent oxidoreductase [unclassified Sphingobium]GLI99242.1 oxidoreductase [Sphingobium sp. BS19]CAH0357093.1 Dihydroanticapsin 7-dehydrogenase [Sphingobium sp. CECT 9361]
MNAFAGRFNGKVVIVTGGASGIGLACCERFAAEGASIGVLDLHGEAANEVAQQIRERHGSAIGVQADVSEPAAIATAIDQVAKAFGRLDVAVNSAGIGGSGGPMKDMPSDVWNRMIAINLSGVFYSMQAEYRHLEAAGGGAIINIASMLGVVGYPEGGAYVAAKHGVVGLTRTAALSWGPQNIRVSVVCPTFIETPMTNHRSQEDWAALAQVHALRRLPEVTDVAATVCFLASEDARALTGSVHMVDAGYTAG